MDTRQFWDLIEQARRRTPDPEDADAIAREATALLATRPLQEIVSAYQSLYQLLADSYRAPLWAAAYLINAGCSDDGFDYFRGWLIIQGRETFEQAVNNPDALADHPAVRSAALKGDELECEDVLGIAWHAYLSAAGREVPADVPTAQYLGLGPDWDFDFDDSAELTRRLPRLAALYDH